MAHYCVLKHFTFWREENYRLHCRFQICRWIEPLVDYEIGFKTKLNSADFTSFILASIRSQKERFTTPEATASNVCLLSSPLLHDDQYRNPT